MIMVVMFVFESRAMGGTACAVDLAFACRATVTSPYQMYLHRISKNLHIKIQIPRSRSYQGYCTFLYSPIAGGPRRVSWHDSTRACRRYQR